MRSIPHTTWVPEFQNNHAGKKQKYISQELPLRLLQTVGISGWTLCNWLAAIKALYHRGVLADGCLNGFESSLMNGVVHQDQPVPAGIFWATGLLLEVNRGHLQNKHAHTHTTQANVQQSRACWQASKLNFPPMPQQAPQHLPGIHKRF